MISEPSRAVPRYLSDLLRNGAPAALSDGELLNRFALRQSERDETAELAFAALLARHGPMVLRVCRGVLGDRHEVEDAFQATFLVLAVRAQSIRRRGSVASWLHGVALRVAGSERSRAARRRRHELVRAAMTLSTTEDAGTDPVCDDELTLVIEEEIGRLPEKYRAVVVLCYLEGLTHEMAAEQLGWPVGSVKSRLAWARERLRVRLTRRGVAPTSVLFDRAGSSRDAGSAQTPVLVGTNLADATLRGALKAGMGKGALAGIVSAEAVALMEGVIKSMTNAKLMLMAAAVLIAGLVTAGAGVMGYTATRPERPALGLVPPSEAHQPAATPQVAQDPPRNTGAKPATDRGPVTIRVEVADPEGHRLSGADVAMTVWYARGSGDTESFLERTKTDGAGQAQLKIAREHAGARLTIAQVWAYQPGRAIATTNVSLTGKAPPPRIHLTLDQPAKWTITVLDPDGQPFSGFRLAPCALRLPNRRRSWVTLPEGWLEPLMVTTDANGVATLAYLSQSMVPLAIRIAGPRLARHTLPLDAPPAKDIVLKLGRSGRVVGVVRTASGQPLADVPVELWVQGSGTLPTDRRDALGNGRITPDEIVRLDSQPLKTGPQGTFQTPSTLLGGSSYRVSIRRDGFVPFVSDWIKLDGQRATVPDIRLDPLQKLTGRILDREGRAVAGARVFLTAGGPAAAADTEGRFALGGINLGKTVILVEHPGFRLQGWLVDPSSPAETGSLTIVRVSEARGPVMRPMADPIPQDESRALANHLLEPYLQVAPQNGDDVPRLAAIASLSEFDLTRALDLLENGLFRKDDFSYQSVRGSLATKLAVKEPARAEALLEAIPDPVARAAALAIVAKALPASERGRKEALLDQATALVRDRLQQANAGSRFRVVSAIAKEWLDLGERDRARLMLGGWKISIDVMQTGFLGQMARLEPDQALAQLQKLPTLNGNPFYRDHELGAVAVELANEHPAEAEQIFNLRENSGAQGPASFFAWRLCHRLARVDPPRARRVAASLRGAGERAFAWAFVALGLAEKGDAGASEAMERAIEEIDRLRELGPGPEPVAIVGGIPLLYGANPAAAILPVVERAAPERLAEVFWRAVALRSRLETDREELLRSSNVGLECALLARYDRKVAAALFEPIEPYLRSLSARPGPRDEFDVSVITAKACIEPRAAVVLLESLTQPRGSVVSKPARQAGLRLAELLGMPSESRWKRVWRSILSLDD